MLFDDRSDMVTNPSENTIAPAAPMFRGNAPTGAGLPRCSEFTMLAAPVFAMGMRAMGHRLSKIVTRTGDAGTTGLGDGSRVAKDSPRIDAIGAVDELNSNLGLLLAEDLPPAVASCLTDVQHDLFDLGGELSIPGYNAVSDGHVERLESAVERFNADLKPLKEFILPAGTRAASLAHVARTVCRRAERALVRLAQTDAVAEPARKYLNRLSDLLFVLARVLNRSAEREDVLWRKDRRHAG
jgi:cob(I)alamin adenosyltransferase